MHQCVDQVLISSTAASCCRSNAHLPVLTCIGCNTPLSAIKPAVEGVRMATDLALATDLTLATDLESSSSPSSSRDRDMRLF